MKHEPPDLPVADHAGIMESGLGPKASAFEKATQVSNDVRNIALDTKGPAVLALAHVNRTGSEQAAPLFHDPRGTGTLEEDAGAAMLLHREERVSRREHVMGCNLAKNRDDRVMTLRLRFSAPFRC